MYRKLILSQKMFLKILSHMLLTYTKYLQDVALYLKILMHFIEVVYIQRYITSLGQKLQQNKGYNAECTKAISAEDLHFQLGGDFSKLVQYQDHTLREL